MTVGVNSANNPFKDFSRVNYNNSREYLSYTQSFEPLPSPSTLIKTKPTDTVEINSKKKPEKSKAKKILTSAVMLVGIGMAAYFGFKGVKSPHFKALLESAKNKIFDIKSGTNNIANSKFSKNAESMLCNVNNLKDDVLDRFLKFRSEKHKLLSAPSKFLNAIGTRATNLYKKIARQTLSSSYTKAYDKVIKAGGSELGIQNFNRWFDNLDKEISDALHNNPKGRISSWSELTKGAEPGIVNKVKGMFKNFTTRNFANDRIEDVIAKSKQTIEINSNWSDELKTAVKEFNRIKLKTGEKLIPRLRDIICGTAPSDLCTITAGATTGAVLIASADTPEERKNTIISKGIPIAFTLSGYALGALFNLSGAKALLAGFGIGKIAQFITSRIDKKLNPKEEI